MKCKGPWQNVQIQQTEQPHLNLFHQQYGQSWLLFDWVWLLLNTKPHLTANPFMVTEGMEGITQINVLLTVQKSAGKPWILPFLWMPVVRNHPSNHSCKANTHPWHQHPDGTPTPQKILRNRLRSKCPNCPRVTWKNRWQIGICRQV